MTEAERITRHLQGDWRGHSGSAPCPGCQPERRRDQRALSISESDGRLLVHCHKRGCDVLAELRNLGFGPDIPQGAGRRRTLDTSGELERQKLRAQRLQAAHDLFQDGVSCAGTPVQTYLESRGIDDLPYIKMVRTLRFHRAVYHGPSGKYLPAMLARIRGHTGSPLGTHRTFLKPDGSGKADVTPAKMMLGPASGGSVRLGSDQPVIALAEGIETALSIKQASGMTVWATLSTSGLKGLILPPKPVAEVVIIAADHDEAGLEAAHVTAHRFEAEGRTVSIIQPPEPGTDFNDMLRSEA